MREKYRSDGPNDNEGEKIDPTTRLVEYLIPIKENINDGHLSLVHNRRFVSSYTLRCIKRPIDGKLV